MNVLSLLAQPEAATYFTIRVVDEQTGRGVPLVELRTVNGIRLFTDSNGIVAFHEPGLNIRLAKALRQLSPRRVSPDDAGHSRRAT